MRSHPSKERAFLEDNTCCIIPLGLLSHTGHKAKRIDVHMGAGLGEGTFPIR
jgi:hypothetical protein